MVFVFRGFVVKVPRMRNHYHFLQGACANWSERWYWKQMRNCAPFGEMVVPTLYCSWFGMIQIQARAAALDRELTDEEKEKFCFITTDNKGVNFGYYKFRLVCIDYG